MPHQARAINLWLWSKSERERRTGEPLFVAAHHYTCSFPTKRPGYSPSSRLHAISTAYPVVRLPFELFWTHSPPISPPRHAVPLVGLVHAGLHHSLRPVREARASLSSPSRPSSASAHSLPPEQTRTCIRWRHQLGLLVIKVTDDKQVSHAPSHHGAHWN